MPCFYWLVAEYDYWIKNNTVGWPWQSQNFRFAIVEPSKIVIPHVSVGTFSFAASPQEA